VDATAATVVVPVVLVTVLNIRRLACNLVILLRVTHRVDVGETVTVLVEIAKYAEQN
jgi:hypothetical protein